MSLREQFPILQRKVNGHPLVYLDNAATTQKPQVVLDAMNAYYSESNANVHRAVHTLAGEATEGYESCRTKLKKRFNASRAIITSGTTATLSPMLGAEPTWRKGTPSFSPKWNTIPTSFRGRCWPRSAASSFATSR